MFLLFMFGITIVKSIPDDAVAEINGTYYNSLSAAVNAVPENTPAIKLYKKHGFVYVGDEDLDRGIEEIPVFSLLEYNL